MVQMKSFFFLFVLVGCVVADAEKCFSSIFQDPSAWGAEDFKEILKIEDFKVVLSPFPSDSVCTAFQGQSSCCSASTHSAINQAQEALEKALEQTERGLAAMNNPNLQDTLTKAFSVLCKSEDCSASVKNAVTKLQESIKNVVDASIRCFRGASNYGIGMVCGICKEGFSQFVDEETKQITLHTNTCNNIYNDCKGIFDAIHELIATVINIYKEILNFNFNIPVAQICAVSDGEVTEDLISCKDFICYSMTNGFGVDASATVKAFDFFNLRLLQLTSAQSPNEMRMLLEEFSGQARNLASNSHNKYSNEGYDAYNVGCESQNSCTNAGNIATTSFVSVLLVMSIFHLWNQ